MKKCTICAGEKTALLREFGNDHSAMVYVNGTSTDVVSGEGRLQ